MVGGGRRGRRVVGLVRCVALVGGGRSGRSGRRVGVVGGSEMVGDGRRVGVNDVLDFQ